MMKPLQFLKPPGAILISDATTAWERHGQDCIAYPKQNGWRFQIHMMNQEIVLYSRTGKNYARKFHATVQQIVAQAGGQNVVLDVEMVGYDINDQPLLPTRLKSAHHHRCWVLDILYLGEQDLTPRPALERLKYLDVWLSNRPGDILVGSGFQQFSDKESWLEFFKQCLRDGLEGAILKRASGDYFKPAYKVKVVDTIDAIVIAGNRDIHVGANRSLKKLLLGVPTDGGDRIAVLGTVDRDELKDSSLWSQVMNAIDPLAQDVRPERIDPTPYLPTVWFAPEIILEVEARAERSAVDPRYTVGGNGGPGYQFDQIAVKRIREDKGFEDATTEEDLIRRFSLPPPRPHEGAVQLTLFDTQPVIRRGTLEMIVGCMFSGKTTQLIDRVEQLRDEGHDVIVFRHRADTRTPAGYLQAHNGLKTEAISVDGASELAQMVALKHGSVIVIDEVQFFDEPIIDTCLKIIEHGNRVIAAGLDLDFRGVPFGPVPQLLACADQVTKMAANCSVCGQPAVFSQRLLDGHPATYFEKIVVPGDENLYQPRCYRHHTVPGKALRLTRTVDTQEEKSAEAYLWDWLQRLRAIGQIGLLFAMEVFDRERYNDILEIAAEIIEFLDRERGVESIQHYREWILPSPEQLSYTTPKVAVAVAVFDQQESVLLVQRSDNNSWALPGGWSDVGYSAAENALREVFQETGLYVQIDGLIGVYDGRQTQVGVQREALYTLLFHGRLEGGEISPHRHEIVAARFVKTNAEMIQQLTGGTVKQVKDAVAYHRAPSLAYFDVAFRGGA